MGRLQTVRWWQEWVEDGRQQPLPLLFYCIASPESCYAVAGSARGPEVTHGVVDVLAFQEALLMEAVFGIALLTMIWVGFRRWLQHKERMGRVMADQTAAQIERVEARLTAVEQMVNDGTPKTAAQIDSPRNAGGT